jgi:hypothetical protein
VKFEKNGIIEMSVFPTKSSTMGSFAQTILFLFGSATSAVHATNIFAPASTLAKSIADSVFVLIITGIPLDKTRTGGGRPPKLTPQRQIAMVRMISRAGGWLLTWPAFSASAKQRPRAFWLVRERAFARQRQEEKHD